MTVIKGQEIDLLVNDPRSKRNAEDRDAEKRSKTGRSPASSTLLEVCGLRGVDPWLRSIDPVTLLWKGLSPNAKA